MLIQNNLDVMNNAHCINETIANANEYRVRINVEFLNGCEFDCPGCFVKRKNQFINNDLSVLNDIINKIRNEGGQRFDEIILGPTDFFAAYNTKEVFENKKFTDIFKNGDVVLTILTTLQSTKEVIEDRIKYINKVLPFPGLEIEVLIPVDLKKIDNNDQEYISDLKSKIQLLNQFDAKVDYACQLNIRDINSEIENFNLPSMTEFIRDEFNTILEFNPSFMRSGIIENVTKTLQDWNNLLESNITKDNKDSITLTISNKYHAGFNELTYTFKNGFLYSCPFIYENVVSLKDEFKINRDGKFYELSDITNFELMTKYRQFAYMNKTSECEDCEHVSSCISKQILYYMETNELRDCLLSKQTMNLYDV